MATKQISLKRIIEELSEKNTDYKYPEQAINQAECLKSLSSDLYTDNIRFIYELIQNADDANAKNVILKILEHKYLIIAHNGKVFDEKDLQGLCGINNGTKKKDPDKTGYKGLGFKAVFGKSNKVIIYSNGEYFRFDALHQLKWNREWDTINQQTWEKKHDRQFIYPWQINPIWTIPTDVPPSIRNFLQSRQNPIDVAYAISLENLDEIDLAMKQLKQQPYMFLFLRHITTMTFINQTTDVISIDPTSTQGLRKISVNNQVISQWIIKRIELDVPEQIRQKLITDTKAPEKLKCMKKAEILFAAKYTISTSGDDGGIEKLPEQNSILFSYLPTKIFEYKFPVLVNANFLTNVNREQIHTDSIWNQWLFEQIGSEIFKWIKELVSNEQYKSQAYRLIPLKLNLINNILSNRFNNSREKSIQNCQFILNREKELLRVNQVIMDSTSMSKQISFINIEAMREYIIDNENIYHQYDDSPFIDYDSNLKQIGVREFTWQECIKMFRSDKFLQTHSIENNKQMIEYFYSKYIKDPTMIIDGINLIEIPFLLDQNNHLQLVKDIYFPAETIGDSGTPDSEDLFVHQTIFNWLKENKQRKIKQWLQNLGVIERTDLTYLHKTIIPNAANYIKEENAIKTILMLFMLFKKNSIGHEELHRLKKLKLLTTQKKLIAAEQLFFSEQYKPRLVLEEYLKTEEDKFLSFEYVLKYKKDMDDYEEWRRFFTMLGVHEELHPVVYHQKLTSYEANTYGFLNEYLLQTSPDKKHTVDAFAGLITIPFIQHTLNNHEFSKFFWSYVMKNLKPEKLKQCLRVYWGHANLRGAIDGTPINDAEYTFWFLKNMKCIPTTGNVCASSNEILTDRTDLKELCGKYMLFPSITFPSNWLSLLNLKNKLLPNDYFDLLEKIRKDEKNFKENFDRIQNIYFYILNEINSWSSNDLKSIETRLNSIYLLTENDQWKLSNELYFYMESNRTNTQLNDATPCLKLALKNRNHSSLNEFLKLLYIKKINKNDLELADKQSSPAEHFRRKLIEISPFLKNWLKHQYVSKDIILTIDKKIQQETNFIESERLHLYYNGDLIQETTVYYDNRYQQLYIQRPWNSERTLMELPCKLCQLLNIHGFEKEIRFLLTGNIDEIRLHFNLKSINIPEKGDIVILPSLVKSETQKKTKPPSAPLSESKKLSTPVPESNKLVTESKKPAVSNKNKGNASNKPENIVITTQTDTPNPINQPPYQQNNVAYFHPPVPPQGVMRMPYQQMNQPFQSCIRLPGPPHIPLEIQQFPQLELIDLPSITQSNSTCFHNQSNGNGLASDLDQCTGRLGEMMVYHYLLNQNLHQLDSVEIKWINQYGETGAPYDISVTKNGRTQYIEVKSTRTYNQNMFPLSILQIEAFLQHRENYFIYRVYVDENKFTILDNIRWRLIEKQQLSCFLKITPILSEQSVN